VRGGVKKIIIGKLLLDESFSGEGYSFEDDILDDMTAAQAARN